jgi:thiol-disulfide isomerase/thioredoxin
VPVQETTKQNNMKQLAVYLIIVLSFSKFGGTNKNNSLIDRKVVISGKILNQDKHPDNYTIKVFENDLVSSLGKEHTALINNDGIFKIEFNKLFSSDIYLNYGSLFTVFVNPGDSIYIEMDADEVLNPNLRNQYILKSFKFSGSSERINNEIKMFLSVIIKNENSLEAFNNEKKLLPDEFLNYLEHNKSKQNHLLDSLLKTNNFSDKFLQWSKLFIDYRFATSLFHYTWYNPFSNNPGKKVFQVIDIPPSFYTAIKDIPIDNERAIINSNYPRFLHEYFMTNTDYNSDFSKKYMESRGKFGNSELFQEEFDKYLLKINQDFKGIANEILLSQAFYSLLDSYKRIDVFENLYPKYKKNLRQNFCLILDAKFSKIKLQEKSPEKNLSLVKQKDGIETIANEVLNRITNKSKGKVIYIDFWATWCGPCLIEFEHSKILAKTYEGKNIDFVYLCIKSKKEEWQNKIREYSLSGSQYLLDDSEYDILSQKFQIVGIPHYVLIDKNGNIIDKNAPHPSSGDELLRLINKYIN